MLYPLSYECLCVLLCWLFLPGFLARSALREQHYMTGGVRRNPFAAPGLTCGNDPCGSVVRPLRSHVRAHVRIGGQPWTRASRGTAEAPVVGDRGFGIRRGGGG